MFREVVPNFARVTSRLSRFLSKPLAKDIGAGEEDEFLALDGRKEKLISPLVLSLPGYNGQYTLDVDACNKQIGCVLLQEQKDQKESRPTRYWSRIPH